MSQEAELYSSQSFSHLLKTKSLFLDYYKIPVQWSLIFLHDLVLNSQQPSVCPRRSIVLDTTGISRYRQQIFKAKSFLNYTTLPLHHIIHYIESPVLSFDILRHLYIPHRNATPHSNHTPKCIPKQIIQFCNSPSGKVLDQFNRH